MQISSGNHQNPIENLFEMFLSIIRSISSPSLLGHVNLIFGSVIGKSPISKSFLKRIFSPMSPDMLPYVGSDAKVKNLFISCGHGPNGWTTSSGTGRFLTQVGFQIVFEMWSSQPIKNLVSRITLKTVLSWSMVRWMKTKRKFKICLIQTDLIKYPFEFLI